MTLRPLVVVGSVNADLVVRVDRMPLGGETVAGASLDLYPGGKGANQAAAAAKLAYPTTMIAQVGADTHAAFMRDSLSGCGVDVSAVATVPEEATGTAIICVQPDGENSIIIVGGANTAPWDLGDTERAHIRGAGMVLLQREIPDDVNLLVAQIARAAGVPVLMDAGGADGPLAPALLECVDTLSPNETELARMTQLPTETIPEVEAAARQLLRMGPPSVLVKLGGKGSLLVTGSEDPVRQEAAAVERVVDTTGAGDCFTAAFAVGLLRGDSTSAAMAFAARAAAYAIQHPGAQTSLPALTDL